MGKKYFYWKEKMAENTISVHGTTSKELQSNIQNIREF